MYLKENETSIENLIIRLTAVDNSRKEEGERLHCGLSMKTHAMEEGRPFSSYIIPTTYLL